jgi:hypothetical protein
MLRLTVRPHGISSGVARTSQLATVLWMSTTSWLVGCGRIWFQTPDDESVHPLPDAPVLDASVDAAVDAPDDIAIASAPRLDVPPKLTMDTVCGSTPQPSLLTVMNSGNADLTIDNASLTGDPFQVKSAPLIIAPGTSGSFKIEPPMAVVGTDLGGSLKRATLKIESNAGTAMVDLEATVIGANLVMTPPASLDFTASSGACPASKSFSVQNTGNLAILVSPDVQGPFAFALASSSDTLLDPGESLFMQVRAATTSQCAGSGNVGFTASSGTICRVDPVLPVTLDIRGSSTCVCS